MDSFELNKIAGAVLFALLVIVGARTVTNIIFTVHKPEKPGMEVEIAEPAQADKKDGAKAEIPLAQLLKDGDAAKGQKAFKPCAACHTFDDGGPNRIGPNLHGVVGKKLASVDGFSYSEALTSKGGSWGYEELSAFLANPKAFAPGTKMAYAGVKNDQKRADLILYLRGLGGNPPPLPDVAAPAQSEKPAPTENKEEAKADGKPSPAADAAAPAQAEKPAPAENKEEAGADVTFAQLLKDGDTAKGQKAIKACAACHTFEEGGANKIGPNLHGIVGKNLASVDGYSYSEALKGKGGVWGYEELNTYLAKPKDFVPGTKMAYPGLKNDQKRADLILYLRSLGGNPPPLPE